jgi:Chaperone of endosialidase
MPSSINASTSGAGGVITTADNSGVLNIQTAGSTAINVTSGQLVNIGTTTSSGQLTVKAASGQGAALNMLATDSGGNAQLVFTGNRTFQIGTGNSGSGFSNILYFYDGTAGATRGFVDSGGTWKFANQGADYAFRIGSDGANYSYRPTNNAGFGVMHFQSDYYSSAGICAYIQANGTYNNTSDARLKKNVTPTAYGLDTVCKLKPVDFNWNQEEDGAQKSCGFIAQDVEQIIPQAVTTMEENNQNTTVQNQKMLSVSTLIPALTKAIQELSAKVDAQAAEIAALKAGA